MSRVFYDQMNRKVVLEAFPPRRIISLVPSQTELLFDLGLDEEIAGITKFCVHPEEKWRTKTRVGGTKKVDIEKIALLRPNLIIGNKEENDRAQIEELSRHYPVWMSDVTSLDDAFNMMKSIGGITGRPENAGQLVEKIKSAFLSPAMLQQKLVSAAYFIWYRPWMVAAGDTFINSMLLAAGFRNVFSHKTRYPEISLEELETLKPQVILLSSEPYPFKEKHIQEIKRQLPETVIWLADGELFSWYGSRMLLAPAYFTNLHTQIGQAVKK